ncbi:MAG: hypothetical protein KatS3mg102_0064 [Planctomycetota bacterium]|nr:MAG: hypothetical protein KatS3mg102_0064 [Planctomycetota bacterium]
MAGWRALLVGVLFAGALWCAAGSARADIVHLADGRMLRGEVLEETPEQVRIRTAAGILTVYRDEIDRIERLAPAESPDAIYRERLAALPPGDADALVGLAQWLAGLGYEEQAQDCYRRALAIEPEHVEAHLALGHVLRRGRWVSPEQAARIDRELGILEPEPGASGEGTAAAEEVAGLAEPPAAAALPPALRGALAELRRGLLSPKPAERARALEQLLALPERCAAAAPEPAAAGEPAEDAPAPLEQARAACRELLLEVRRARLRQYERERQQLARTIPTWSDPRYQRARERLLERWVAAKDEALKTIFDLEIYPEEDHGRKGQPIVDEKVEAVRAAYEPYERLLLDDLRVFLRLGESEAQAFAERLAGRRAAVAELDVAAPRLGAPQPPPPAEPPAVLRALLLYRAGRIAQAWALARDARLGPWEMRLLERLRDVRVAEYNQGWLNKTSVTQGKLPTRLEVEQVRITNEYRMLMGLHALEIDPRLIESARGHSEEMTRLGYFAHESPVPERRTPSMRAQLAGYPGGVAENISQGSPTPQATHEAWYNSSGHHRNILGASHQAMGAGLDGMHWTQNFGGTATLVR